MMTPIRYVFLVLAIIVSLHFILSFSHEDYNKATSLSRITGMYKETAPPKTPPTYYDYGLRNSTRANATFVLLARNADLSGIVSSMKQMEDRFNKHYNYPYVFLNEEPFSEEFKQ
ncbi:uncharacterized protein FIBRA_04457 [Fibroporia radiculosa]|uniref:Glycolipid 2-alpha-mannosyltransferase n=1 Tax=Fibroporia radiculosa TaxID=599839 RepID=J4HWJ3_9APHY|nr:uncharacterized protein FIBRA_04457 [Fibroporia radiculosa]CCM02362.1 predicted protein [Fibroporia radiculosa]